MTAATTNRIATLFDDSLPSANSAPTVDASDDAGPIRILRDGASTRPRRSLFRSPVTQVGTASIFFGIVLLDVLDEWIFGGDPSATSPREE